MFKFLFFCGFLLLVNADQKERCIQQNLNLSTCCRLPRIFRENFENACNNNENITKIEGELKMTCYINCIFKEMKALNLKGEIDRKKLKNLENDIFSGVSVITSHHKKKIIGTCFELIDFEKYSIRKEMYAEDIKCNLIPKRFYECLHSEMLVNCPPVLWKDNPICDLWKKRIREVNDCIDPYSDLYKYPKSKK